MAIIGLEATRASKDQKTGTEWYAWHVIKQLTTIDNQNQYRLYYRDKLDPQLIPDKKNVELRSLWWPLSKLWTNFRLSWELLVHPIDLFFSINSLPLFGSHKLIVVIHDLGFYRQPELYNPLERWFHKFEHWLMVKKAEQIIAVSEATKQDIITYFPNSQNKIKVVYNGFDQELFQPFNEEEIEQIKIKYQLPKKYFFYVGRIEAKKNILHLVKSFAKNITSHDWCLLLAGRPGNHGYSEIVEYLHSHHLEDRIQLLGYIDNKKYYQLLGCSDIFVFPSKFEGFGIPLIEAMHCAVPVLCSNLPVFQEIAGSAVHYFKLEDSNSLEDEIIYLIKNPEKLQQLKETGLLQSQRYSWSKCATDILDIINQQLIDK